MIFRVSHMLSTLELKVLWLLHISGRQTKDRRDKFGIKSEAKRNCLKLNQ